MVDELGTNHHWIEFDTPEVVAALNNSTLTRDLPGMADVDSSLYLFCREIKKELRSLFPARLRMKFLADILGSTGRIC